MTAPTSPLAGRAALVTGGASGIGLATARAFVREGVRVLVCDLDESAGRALVEELAAAGGEASFARADVTREADVEAAVRQAVAAFGGLDCAVNSAGITGEGGAVHDLTLEAWSRTLLVNLTGVFLCLKHELSEMHRRGGGAIVNVASGAGFIGVPGLSPYSASKHGVLGLTRSAAQENARTGVRVNAVCPGSTDTPMLRSSMASSPELEKIILASSPAGRLGRPEEVAEACVWLCSDRASFVNGASLVVDGGAVAR